MAYPAPTKAMADSRYVCALQRRSRYFLCYQEGHFVASCPIRVEMFCFMKQEGRNNVPPARHALSPTSSAEGVANDDGTASLN